MDRIEGNELAVKEADKFLVPSSEVSIDVEELEGLNITFDVIKIPSGGITAFEVPGDDPDNPDAVKEIEAVIVDHYPMNAYYEGKYDGQNNPPTCSSLDGKAGLGTPGGNCKTCHLNQYGTGEAGTGKACKNLHRLFLLKSGDMLPTRLTLPPTSLQAFNDYIVKKVVMKGMKSCDVITKITLKKEQSKSGITYAQAQFAMGRILNDQDRSNMRTYSAQIKTMTRGNRNDDSSNVIPF